METDSSEAVAQESQPTAVADTAPDTQTPPTEVADQTPPEESAEDWVNAAMSYEEPTAAPEQTEEPPEQPVGETPPVQETVPAEPTDEPSAETPGETPEPESDPDSESYRQRVRTSDPMMAEVLKLQKASPDTPYAEIHAQAQQNLADAAGIVLPEPEHSAQEPEDQDDPSSPKSVAELEQRLDELMEAKVKAQTEDYDVAEAGRIEKEIYDLQKLGKPLAEREAQQGQQQQEQQSQEIAAANTKAEQYYPESAVEGSELHQEMVKLHKVLTDTGDDRVSEPDYVWQLAKMAARNKNVAPIDPSNSPAPSPNAAATVAAKTTAPAGATKPPIASGSARSNSAPPTPPDPLKGVTTDAEYYDAMEAVRLGQATLAGE